jgi:hypothetical protein
VWGSRALSALIVVLLLGAAALAMTVGGAAASSTTGYDISYPQCNGSFPASPGFGIVGVNNGKPYSVNPCVGTGDGPSELQWAGMNAQFYANTADPGPTLSTHWPNGQTSPEQCNTASNPGSDTAQCAYDYGWNAAADSYQGAVNAYIALGWAQAGATRTPVADAWWLDVETANSWTSNTAFNTDELQGEIDYLKSAGTASVGFYSTPSDWQTITGGTTAFAAYESWMPGASTQSQAQANCAGGGVTGGGVALTQYPFNGFDADYQCGAPPASLSFAGTPQTLTAGASSGPMSVALPHASSSATSVTLTSSSSAGSFATSPSGPWSSSLMLSVPAGSTSSASFYYTDTRAGQPVLTASASGYSDATQTEAVTAAALATIAVTPTSAQVRVGGHVSFSAAGQDRYGNSASVTPTWSVSPALGNFSPNPGNPTTFTAGSSGSGTVTASAGSISGQASITVTTKKHTQLAAHTSAAQPSVAMLVRMSSTVLCVPGRRLDIRLRKRAATELRALLVLIDGKTAKTLRVHAPMSGIELRLPSEPRYTVTIVALTRSGRRITTKYAYRACAASHGLGGGQPPTMLPARPGG